MTPIPGSPVRISLARAPLPVAAAVLLAGVATVGCQTAGSGEWSTRHKSMSVDKSAEAASQRVDTQLPVPEVARAPAAYADMPPETAPAAPVVKAAVTPPAGNAAVTPPAGNPIVTPPAGNAVVTPPASVEAVVVETETVEVAVEIPAEIEPEPEPAFLDLPEDPPAAPARPLGVTDAPPPTAVIERPMSLPDPMHIGMAPSEAAVELLAVAARSPFAALRANALEGLSRRPDRLRPLAGNALVDTNRGVRFVAASLVGRGQLCDLAPLLEPLLRDESDSVRAGAIASLAECGMRVDQSPLARMARSEDPEIRANAYLALGMIGNRSATPMIRESLGKGMRLVNPLRVKLVELQGGEALVKLGDIGEIEPIRAALFAPGEQGELTVLACQILGRLGDQQSQGALLRLARPSGEDIRPIEIRLAALRALGDLGYPERAQLLELVTPSLSDLSPMIRAQACFALGAIGGPEAVRRIVPLMADLDPNVQVAAASAVLAASRDG